MNISINNKVEQIPITQFDDISTIRKRLAIRYKTFDNYIIITPDEELNDKTIYNADILDIELRGTDLIEITEFDEKNIINQDFITKLSKKYNAPIENILMHYIYINKYDINDYESEYIVDDVTILISIDTYIKYIDTLTNIQDNYKTYINTLSKNAQKTKNIKTVDISEFKEAHSDFFLTVDIDNNVRLIDIFDNFRSSELIPIIIYHDESVFYKIYETYLKEVSDIDLKISTRKKKFVYFKINNDDEFIDVVWDDKNNIYFYINNYKKLNKKFIIDSFFSFITIDYKILSETVTSIGGIFEAYVSDFQRYVFADLVFNNSIISTNFFINEGCWDMRGCKTSSQKKKFYIMYGDKDVKKSLTFLIIPEDNKLKITVQKSRSISQLSAFLKELPFALGIYNNEKDTIINDYASYKFFKIEKKEPKKIKEKIPKTKEKIDALNKFDPILFKKPFYVKEVQKQHQPTLIDKKDIHKYKNVLEFTDSREGAPTGYYVCDEKNGVNVYPQIKAKVGSLKSFKTDSKYAEDYELWASARKGGLPTCLSKPSKPKEEKRRSGYIKKKAETIVEEGLLSELPTNLQYIFPDYFKQGSPKSNNSFLYCVLNALQKNDSPEKIRGKLAKLGDKLNIIKQEMPYENIEEYINSQAYFDPDIFVRLLEYYFDINIFLFDIKNPKGNILLPKSIGPYISFQYNPNKKSIAILCHREVLGYHCELITTKKRDSILPEKFVKNIIEIYNEYTKNIIVGNRVSVLKLLDSNYIGKPISQGIDENGKVYLLNYDTYSILTSPSPPLPIPINNTIKTISYKSLDKDIKKLSMGVTENKKGLVLDHPSFFESYVPLKDIINGKIIDISIFSTDKKSINISQKIAKNRKIANMLKEYVLYTYAVYDDVTFNVDENYKYEISDNFESLVDDVITVTNKETKKKLQFYLDTMIFSLGKDTIKKLYENKTYIPKQYEYIFDFTMRIGEKIFDNEADIYTYIEISKVPKYEVVKEFMFDVSVGYFFQNEEFVNGRLVIIQNVDSGKKEKALSVAIEWYKTKVNVGYLSERYNSEKIYKDIDATIYDYNDFSTFNKKPSKYNLLKNGEMYSAILFL